MFLAEVVNAGLALVWTAVLLRLAVLFPLVGRKWLAGGIADFFIGTATASSAVDLAAAVHTRSARGWAVLLAGQRLFVAWGVLWQFPRVARHGLFAVLVLAWSVQGVLRYTLAYQGHRRGPPSLVARVYALEWWVTMPAAAAAEWGLTLLSLRYAGHGGDHWSRLLWYRHVLQAVLVVYVPTAYALLQHAYSTRTRVVKPHSE